MNMFFWKLGHLIASIGCRFNGGHPRPGRLANYCIMCGRRFEPKPMSEQTGEVNG